MHYKQTDNGCCQTRSHLIAGVLADGLSQVAQELVEQSRVVVHHFFGLATLLVSLAVDRVRCQRKRGCGAHLATTQIIWSSTRCGQRSSLTVCLRRRYTRFYRVIKSCWIVKHTSNKADEGTSAFCFFTQGLEGVAGEVQRRGRILHKTAAIYQARYNQPNPSASSCAAHFLGCVVTLSSKHVKQQVQWHIFVLHLIQGPRQAHFTSSFLRALTSAKDRGGL